MAWQEGDTVQNDAGDTLVVIGGKWVTPPTQSNASSSSSQTPSTWEDIKTNEPAAGVRGLLQASPLVAAPTVADVAAGVTQAGADYAAGPGNPVSRGAYAVHQMLEPYTYEGLLAAHPELQTQAKTPGGKFAQTLTEWAPSVLSGASFSDAPLAAVGKGMLAATGSEAAGQASQGQPWEPLARVGGAIAAHSAPGIARGIVSPGGVGPEEASRIAAANRLTSAGFPVSAAQTTGSRLMATLEGPQAAPDMSEGILKGAGVVRKQGPYDDRSDVIAALKSSLTGPGSRIEDLKANTNLYPTPQLTQGLANIVGEHQLAHSGTSIENPKIDQAFQDFLTHATTGKLTGKQYADMRQSWNESGIPELQSMAKLLDAGMNASNNGPQYQGAWQKYWNDYANLKGAQAGQAAAGNLAPYSPGVVANAIHKDTPLKRLAQAGADVYENQPKPYSLAGPLAAAGALGAGLGAYHGGIVSEQPLTGFFTLPGMLAAGGYGVSRLAKTAPVQAYAKNQLWKPSAATSLDPATVARILALRSGAAGQTMLDQPQQGQ
jgi:hypothetical protein